ncbi:MAG: hypothetical protein AB8B60_09165 [Sulfitobacter sp.]
MTPPADVVARIKALPDGTATGTAFGRKYIFTHSTFSAGKATKLVAEELGGADYISLNIYDLAKGAQLYPCEMPAEKVIAFVQAFTPDAAEKP